MGKLDNGFADAVARAFMAKFVGIVPAAPADFGKFLCLDPAGNITPHPGSEMYDVTLVGNTGVFTIDASSIYHVDVHGVLTAPGTLIPNVLIPASSAFQIIMHNVTTGNFPLNFVGQVIPRGLSVWIWNPLTSVLEFICQQNDVVCGTLEETAAQAIPAAVWTKVLISVVAPAPTIQKGGITDAVNSRFIIPAGMGGDYKIDAGLGINGTGGAASNVAIAIAVNGVRVSVSASVTLNVGAYEQVVDTDYVSLVAGDIVELQVFGSTAFGIPASSDCYMSLLMLGRN